MKAKICLFLFSFLLFFPLFSSAAFGQIVINEISPSEEWVELFNTSSSEVLLDGCVLSMGDSNQAVSFGSQDNISSFGYRVVEKGVAPWNSNWLNNSGDSVSWDCPSLTDDSASYGSEVELLTYGRSPNGSGDFLVLSVSSKGSQNPDPSTPTPTEPPTSSPTPTLTGVPTNTPTPIPTKATYKINEVKDGDGNKLSSVEIYVDGAYVHHYAPETLTFCDGCKCDTYVDCGFGEHTIRLEKSGYDNWSQTKTINAGNSFEVDPVMSPSSDTDSSPTSTPTLTPTPTSKANTPTPTPKPTAKLSPTPTSNPEVLGEGATESGLFLLDEATPNAAPTPSGESGKKPKDFLAISLIGLGVILIGAALVPFIPKEKIKGITKLAKRMKRRGKNGGIIKPTELNF